MRALGFGHLDSTSGICWAWSSWGCWPLLQKPGEYDGGETRTGHHEENLARGRATFFPGVCSEPGTAGDHRRGRGAQGPVQVNVARNPKQRAWPPGRRASEQTP